VAGLLAPPSGTPAGVTPADANGWNRRRRRTLRIRSCIFEVLGFSGYVFESLCASYGKTRGTPIIYGFERSSNFVNQLQVSIGKGI
jgi:hypothetical protein